MKKDIKWLKKEISKRDKRTIYTYDLMCLINKLDEPEVLSREWLDENKSSWTELKVDGYYIPVEKLQNLLVPKQGELETKIHELIESYKQEEDAYSNPENGWISGFIEDLKNLVAEEPLYHALIKGHELMVDKGDWTFKYWKCDTSNGRMFPSHRLINHGDFLTEMTKEDWNELGINDSNADFVKV